MTSKESQRARVTGEVVRVLAQHEEDCFRIADKTSESVYDVDAGRYADRTFDPQWVEERRTRYREAHKWLTMAVSEFLNLDQGSSE